MSGPTAAGDRLTITVDAYDAILAHAREDAPHEAVGVLVGDRTDPERVTRVERARNAAANPGNRYALDPVDQLSLLEGVEEAGDDVVGFYHSHPHGPDGPSGVDRDRATWEGYVYAIASLADEPTLRAWRWSGDEFEPLAVAVDS